MDQRDTDEPIVYHAQHVSIRNAATGSPEIHRKCSAELQQVADAGIVQATLRSTTNSWLRTEEPGWRVFVRHAACLHLKRAMQAA